jgi:hypothetical protein
VWGGVISAAVYVPLLQGVLVPEDGTPAGWGVPDVIRQLSAFHRRMETEGERRSSVFCCSISVSHLPEDSGPAGPDVIHQLLASIAV